MSASCSAAASRGCAPLGAPRRPSSARLGPVPRRYPRFDAASRHGTPCSRSSLAVVSAFAVPAVAGATITLPAGFQQRTVLSGLAQPTAVRFAPNSDARVRRREARHDPGVRRPDGHDAGTGHQPAPRGLQQRRPRAARARGRPAASRTARTSTRCTRATRRSPRSTGAAPDDVARCHQPIRDSARHGRRRPGLRRRALRRAGLPEASGRLVRIEVNPVTGVHGAGTPPEPQDARVRLVPAVLLALGRRSALRRGRPALRERRRGRRVRHGRTSGSAGRPLPGRSRARAAHSAPRTRALRADPTGLSGAILRVDPDTGAASTGNPFTTGDANQQPDHRLRPAQSLPLDLPPGNERPLVRRRRLGSLGGDQPDPATRRSRRRNFGWPCFEGDWQDSNPQRSTRTPPACCARASTPRRARRRSSATYHTTYRGTVLPDAVPPRLQRAAARPARRSPGLAFYDGGDYPAALRRRALLRRLRARLPVVHGRRRNGIPDRAKVAAVRRRGTPTPTRPRVSLERGPGGDIFIVDIASGAVRRLRYGAVDARASADVTSGPTPLTVHLDASATSSTRRARRSRSTSGTSTATAIFETDTGSDCRPCSTRSPTPA